MQLGGGKVPLEKKAKECRQRRFFTTFQEQSFKYIFVCFTPVKILHFAPSENDALSVNLDFVMN